MEKQKHLITFPHVQYDLIKRYNMHFNGCFITTKLNIH